MTRKNLLIIILTAFILFSFFPKAFADVEKTIVRVGLSSNTASVNTSIQEGSYQLTDEATGLKIGFVDQGSNLLFVKVGNSIEVIINGESKPITFRGPIHIEPVNKAELSLFSYRNTRYRDDYRVEVYQNGLLITNCLDIEKYLYGVVGPEMGYGFPQEALKAQAVVSRSYALSMINTRNHYDVGIDTMTQVYRGYDAEIQPNGQGIINAVDSTRGEVIFHRASSNRPIQAYFHANAGGYTENSENVWSNPLPYIKAVPSPYDSYALEYGRQTNSWPANSYQWTVNYSRTELLDLISQWNTQSKANDREDRLILVGKLQDIQVKRNQRNSSEETASGRVTELIFVGDQGEKSFYRDFIRTVLGLRSTMFDVKLDSEVTILGSDGSAQKINDGTNLFGIGGSSQPRVIGSDQGYYYVKGADRGIRVMPQTFQNIEIIGKGHGHGLGMSQWGAIGMANNGYNYTEIIKHYYGGQDKSQITIEKYR
ncbi:stage II sporulation protein D [Desulfitispora alkaliphila]|uniref:SpoIID/LytB domain-containing protein n=1 Tax=Desulfitispora alkaliphila TaxID=622674 RepID=UPI003D1C75D7